MNAWRNFLFTASVVLVLCTTTMADVFGSRIVLTNPDGSRFDGDFKDGTAAKIAYVLNDSASSVIVKVVDAVSGNAVVTINAGKQNAGMNSVSWDGSGSVSGKKYYVSVTATQATYSSTKYKAFFFIATGANGKNIYTRGVDAKRDQNKPGFGYLYVANSDPTNSTRLRTGILRYTADCMYAGTDSGDPMLLNSLGTTHPGGVFDWGITTTTTSPWYATLDSKGRIYASGNNSGNIYRLDNDSAAPKIIVRGLNQPRGLAAVGEGANFKLYIAADTVVVRANLGTSDTLSTQVETVAVMGNYVRDVLIDDEGDLIVGLRSGAAGTTGLAVERYNISGTLPVRRGSEVWSIPFTGQPIGLAMKRGSNETSVTDDTLYVSVRDNVEPGIHEITGLDNAFTILRTFIFQPSDVPASAGGNISTNADLTVDFAGNIILFENGNEEIFMIAPPSSAPSRTLTTRGYDTAMVSVALSVEKESEQPSEFLLYQNYPNPFNPTTTIGYQLPTVGRVRLAVFDMLGRQIALLDEGETTAGYHAAVWNATDARGVSVPSGVYVYVITASLGDGRSLTETRRMVLLK